VSALDVADKSPKQSVTLTYADPAVRGGATAVADSSLTIASVATVPLKLTWPDCPPVQP
jgi:hypothetical protein